MSTLGGTESVVFFNLASIWASFNPLWIGFFSPSSDSSAQTQDQIRNMDIHKSEVNFTFEIADVQELFDRRDENWGSEFFYCRSIPFYVNLKYARGGNDYLSAGLVLYNPMDTYTYHMSGVYELRLVNWQGKGDFIRKYEYVFDESGKVFGPRFFISATDLLHEPSDWIKDKKIKLKVNLTCGNLYRTYSSK